MLTVLPNWSLSQPYLGLNQLRKSVPICDLRLEYIREREIIIFDPMAISHATHRGNKKDRWVKSQRSSRNKGAFTRMRNYTQTNNDWWRTGPRLPTALWHAMLCVLCTRERISGFVRFYRKLVIVLALHKKKPNWFQVLIKSRKIRALLAIKL